MTTNVKPGMQIKIAVPLDPTDNTPIGTRRETRLSRVEAVTEAGIVKETEGQVRADRMGVDWEIVQGEAQDPKLVVVKTQQGPVLGTLLRVAGPSVEVYSEELLVPGIMVLRASDTGAMWDWLRGRSVAEVAKTLTLTFGEAAQPDQGKATPLAPTAPQDEPAKKKRGPKPKADRPAQEEQPGAVPPPPFMTGPALPHQVIPTFRERVQIANAADRLLVEAETGNIEHVEGVIDRLRDICEAARARSLDVR